ncbi:MAG: c-type cytochrome [Terriglobales bacterium]
MKKTLLLSAVAVGLIAVTALMSAAPEKSYSPQQVSRGKYLVNDVGACQDCHTPRNEHGEYIQEQWLSGAPIMFKSTVPIPNWADKAANIAGLPGWTDEQAIKFLMTGVAYNGLEARPPMPQYRFSRADAAAMVAYLRSLEPSHAVAGEAAKKAAEKEKK